MQTHRIVFVLPRLLLAVLITCGSVPQAKGNPVVCPLERLPELFKPVYFVRFNMASEDVHIIIHPDYCQVRGSFEFLPERRRSSPADFLLSPLCFVPVYVPAEWTDLDEITSFTAMQVTDSTGTSRPCRICDDPGIRERFALACPTGWRVVWFSAGDLLHRGPMNGRDTPTDWCSFSISYRQKNLKAGGTTRAIYMPILSSSGERVVALSRSGIERYKKAFSITAEAEGSLIRLLSSHTLEPQVTPRAITIHPVDAEPVIVEVTKSLLSCGVCVSEPHALHSRSHGGLGTSLTAGSLGLGILVLICTKWTAVVGTGLLGICSRQKTRSDHLRQGGVA